MVHPEKRKKAYKLLAAGEGGWLKAIREAKGESYTQASSRLKKARGTIQALEKSEVSETISLKSLRDFVEAYGYKLHITLETSDFRSARLMRAHRELTAAVLESEAEVQQQRRRTLAQLHLAVSRREKRIGSVLDQLQRIRDDNESELF